MRNRYLGLLVAPLLGGLLSTACRETLECEPGTLSCQCAANSACDDGLVCQDDICIDDGSGDDSSEGEGTSTSTTETGGDGDEASSTETETTGEGDATTGDGDGDSGADPVCGNGSVETGEICYTLGQTLDPDEAPAAVALADFVGDEELDLLVVLDGSGDRFMVYPGDGSGSFDAAPVVTTGWGIGSGSMVRTGDLNEDGQTDIIYYNGGSVFFQYGVGDGSFSGEMDLSCEAQVRGLAIGQFTDDEHLDVACVSVGLNVSFGNVIPGNGDGTYGSLIDLAGLSGSGFYGQLAMGDLDGNAFPDLVSGTTQGAELPMSIQTAAGVFNDVTSVAGGIWPQGLDIGDFDDNDLGDVLVGLAGSDGMDGQLVIVRQTNPGAFAPGDPFEVGIGPIRVAAVDVNSDGWLDAISLSGNEGSLSFVAGNGLGGFGASEEVFVGAGPRDMAVADINGDGVPDIVTANHGAGTVSVVLSTP
jgi:hypothetical protein